MDVLEENLEKASEAGPQSYESCSLLHEAKND